MRLIRALIVVLILGVFIAGCGDGDSDLSGVAYPRIRLLLAPGARQAEITRVVLSVSGPDMETQDFELSISDDGKTASGVISVTSGRNRLFTVVSRGIVRTSTDAGPWMSSCSTSRRTSWDVLSST